MKKLLALPLGFALVLLQLSFPIPVHAGVETWIRAASVIPLSQTDFSSNDFKQSVRNFQAIGGNYVNFIVPYYQSNTGSTDIARGWNTPTDESMTAGIQFAHSIGMKAQVSIYLETHSGEWRAHIHPGDRNTWYQKYGEVLVHYGRLSQAQGVELYMLGAELIDMTSGFVNSDNTTQWNAMIGRVRQVYSGPLVYSANRPQSDPWASEASHVGFWDKMSYLGLAAYYELPGDGSVASLEGNWQNLNNSLISPLQRFGKPVLFTEIGYKSVSGAHNRPWDFQLGGPYDPQEQVNDYTALINFWSRQGFMQGVELWWWSPNPNYGGTGNTDYTPQNKPAQETLRQLWASGGTPTPAPPSTTPPPPPTPPPSQPPAPPPPSQAIVMVNGYPTVSSNFIDCNGNIDNDPNHHTTNPADTDPAHRVGQNCPAGTLVANFLAGGVNNPPAPAPGPAPAPAPSPAPAPIGSTIDIWWPTSGAHIPGLQPFKALLQNTDVSQYSIFWQVDSGGLVPMPSNFTDFPHKEALVDLANWSWNGAGPYSINFLARNNSGSIVSQRSIQIFSR